MKKLFIMLFIGLFVAGSGLSIIHANYELSSSDQVRVDTVGKKMIDLAKDRHIDGGTLLVIMRKFSTNYDLNERQTAIINRLIYFISSQQVVAPMNETSTIPDTATSGDCPNSYFLDVVADPANSEYEDPMLSVRCDDEYMYVTTNKIPNYEYIAKTPNALEASTQTYKISLTPSIATTPTSTEYQLGALGVLVNGIPLYGPSESPMHNYADAHLEGLLDFCGGHTSPAEYHNHIRPDCRADLEPGTIIGYSFDGFPVRSPYLEDGSKLTSSYQRTNSDAGADVFTSNEYIAGLGDLDECNGKVGADGSYSYYATDSYPYFIGCYVGTPESSNNSGGPFGGGQPGNIGGQERRGPPPARR